MSQWRNAKTDPPKDREEVFAWVFFNDTWKHEIAWYDPIAGNWYIRVGYVAMSVKVSHWMPCPPVPEAEKRSG